VQTAIVDLYSKLGYMVTAQKVYDEMLVKNVVLWNSILSGYLKFGSLAEAQRVFDKIPRKDIISWKRHGLCFSRYQRKTWLLGTQ